MNNGMKKHKLRFEGGSVLVLTAFAIVILAVLGVGILTVGYGLKHSSVRYKNEAAAMLAAEAGYEKAVFWMSQQPDMLEAVISSDSGLSGEIEFAQAKCNYRIEFDKFIGYRPVYRIISTGQSGVFQRTVNVQIVQALSGWDMGQCRVPISSTSTGAINFVSGEVIDMPLNINRDTARPNSRDIHIIGNPRFLQHVAMGESRYTSCGSDKYSSVMNLFEGGISFNQPDSRVVDRATIEARVERFRESTLPEFRFSPVGDAPVPNPHGAVQLELWVDGDGDGRLRITNNCTVRGFQQSWDNRTYDFTVDPDNPNRFTRYDIYGYHLKPETEETQQYRIEDTYVSQTIGSFETEPGGQIYIDGNVIIGGNRPHHHDGDQVLAGKLTVVATGNIWIADSIRVDGPRDENGMPSLDNPNVLGLIAKGVIKVVDPGMTDPDVGQVGFEPLEIPEYEYRPIGLADAGYLPEDPNRHLPDPTVVEAAITIAGGGWGAENVRRGSYGGRKHYGNSDDDLVVRGSIVEFCRAPVALSGQAGYLKNYFMDERLLTGILPGDIWLRGKYIPAPAGWSDYRLLD